MTQSQQQKLPGWARALAVVVGLVSIIAGLLVLVFPELGLLVVVYFLAFAFLLLGIERLAMGITGHPHTHA
jgi:uncharacterized membrane protein HdeD (DUF308 family)